MLIHIYDYEHAMRMQHMHMHIHVHIFACMLYVLCMYKSLYAHRSTGVHLHRSLQHRAAVAAHSRWAADGGPSASPTTRDRASATGAKAKSSCLKQREAKRASLSERPSPSV